MKTKTEYHVWMDCGQKTSSHETMDDAMEAMGVSSDFWEETSCDGSEHWFFADEETAKEAIERDAELRYEDCITEVVVEVDDDENFCDE